MRAVLIVNPIATTSVPDCGDILTRAIGSVATIEVVVTERPGHAAEIAANAAADGVDLIVIHGGDGTINEVVNGLLPAPVDQQPPAGPFPRIAILPGGSANVFARANGIANSPRKAAQQLARLLASDEDRTVGLGFVEGRWFTFSAGLGFDARVCELVDEQRKRGKTANPLRYVKTAFEAFFTSDREKPTLTVERAGHAPEADLYFAFVSITSPWTYFGPLPVHTNATTRSDRGLGVFALRTMNLLPILTTAGQMLVRRGGPTARELLRDDNVASVRLTSTKPMPFQLDGDYLGMRSDLEFFAIPNTLTVVAPHKTAG